MLETQATPPAADNVIPLDAGRPRGLSSGVRERLQAAIEKGELAPGAALDERELAQQFGVSRTPVREALQQLVALGLVEMAPRQGARVTRLSVGRVRAMMEAIGELEALCAKLAARRVDSALAQALDETLGHCQETAVRGTPADYEWANDRFHEVIYVGSRNAHLAGLIRSARRLIQRYRVSELQTRSQMSKSLQDHLRIARAIQQGDEAAASAAMLLHVPAGSTGFSEFLATVPPGFFGPDAAESFASSPYGIR